MLERVPGLTEFLAWLDGKGLKKAAVTNAPKENARVMLEALSLGCDCCLNEISRPLAAAFPSTYTGGPHPCHLRGGPS